VKLSGAYQDSKVGPPSYSDTVPVARAYIKAAPERMVWAKTDLAISRPIVVTACMCGSSESWGP
jgi:hypothetical protein